MFFIVSGEISCYSTNERQLLLKLTEGDWFGEKSLTSLTQRSHPIIADTFCTVFFISKSNFDRILSEFPQIHTIIQKRRTLPSFILTILVEDRIRDLVLEEEVLKHSLSLNREQLTRDHIDKVLLAMEIPMQYDIQLSPRSKNKKGHDALNLRKIQLISSPDLEMKGIFGEF
jgi:CRP-like cAMP-binding protein